MLSSGKLAVSLNSDREFASSQKDNPSQSSGEAGEPSTMLMDQAFIGLKKQSNSVAEDSDLAAPDGDESEEPVGAFCL